VVEEEEEEGPRKEWVEKRPRKPGAWTGLATPVGGREGGSEEARKRGGEEEMRYGRTVYARV